MPAISLGKAAVAAIHRAVETLFARTKVRLLGRTYGPRVLAFGTSGIPPAIGHRDDLSIHGVFDHAARTQGVTPDGRLRESAAHMVEQYLDAYQEATKAHVVHAVESTLRDADREGVKTDLKTVLGGELYSVLGRATRDVRRLVESEVTRTRNVALLDASARVAALSGGAADPTVAFLGPNDGSTCPECLRLFFLPDGVTPRAWRQSEVGFGYHKRGDQFPHVGGTHPNCRHSPVTIRIGYGFKGGMIAYISPGYDVLAAQRG